MGIFDVFKKKNEKTNNNEFKSTIIKTDNISKSLTDVAKQYNLSVSNLDFDILSYETYVKLSKEQDFVIADEQTFELLKDEKLLLNPEVEITQSYEIKIKKFQFVDDFELIGKFKFNKTLTKSVYSISPSSLLFYSDTLEFQIKEELNKKKAKSGLLINFDLFEEKMESDIQELIAKLRVLGSIENDFDITLCEAIEPVFPIHMKIIEHYKKHEKEDSRIKELIYPIKKGDMIIEILKPKKGKNGRNCKGKIIKIHNIKDEEIPEYKINDDVTKRDDENRIRYIANKNGYVYIKENVIIIKDEMEVNQISLKTGNVRGATDSDVKLEVKESAFLKEAIKDGMVVETTELVVKGNVGNGAKIKAKKLEIDGQTHKGSKILAHYANINIHKGKLKAKNCEINRLEGGIIEADIIKITQAISGKIKAREIYIDILGSHITMIASELIEIQTLKGSENRFIIDESSVENKEDIVNEIEEKIKQIEIKIRNYKDKYNVNKRTILKNKPIIEEIKFKIKSLREEKKAVNPNYIQKVKKYNDFVKKTKLIEEEIKKLKENIEILKDKLQSMQNGVFNAKVISKSGFNEFNRIEFHLIEPPMKITYDTKKSDEDITMFVLKDYGDLDYRIEGIKE